MSPHRATIASRTAISRVQPIVAMGMIDTRRTIIQLCYAYSGHLKHESRRFLIPMTPIEPTAMTNEPSRADLIARIAAKLETTRRGAVCVQALGGDIEFWLHQVGPRNPLRGRQKLMRASFLSANAI
jgi:hypothetical protein